MTPFKDQADAERHFDALAKLIGLFFMLEGFNGDGTCECSRCKLLTAIKDVAERNVVIDSFSITKVPSGMVN